MPFLTFPLEVIQYSVGHTSQRLLNVKDHTKAWLPAGKHHCGAILETGYPNGFHHLSFGVYVIIFPDCEDFFHSSL